jgi:hypothetical protein
MLLAVPLVHPGERGIALMDGVYRPLGEHSEVLVGYDRRYFNDQIGVRFEAGHFQIDPDEVFGRLHAMSFEDKAPMVPERMQHAA